MLTGCTYDFRAEPRTHIKTVTLGSIFVWTMWVYMNFEFCNIVDMEEIIFHLLDYNFLNLCIISRHNSVGNEWIFFY